MIFQRIEDNPFFVVGMMEDGKISFVGRHYDSRSFG